MAACTICNLCDNPTSLRKSSEVGRINCNVRKFKNNVFTIWRCTGCNSLHCADDADLDAYYADYPLKRQKVTFSERIGYANRLRLLERQGLRKDHSVLDYGCGAGLFVQFLRDKGYKQAFGYDSFVAGYSDPAALARTYDAVVTYDVIEHDDDTHEFIRVVSQLVLPGGILVVGTPNADNVRLEWNKEPSLHPPYHRHILSERSLLAIAREKGMEPAHVYLRSFYDSLVPTVNSRFMWRYIAKSGGMLDSAVEPPQTGLVLRSPELLFWAFFGYFRPRGDWMLVTFRKPAAAKEATV